MSDSVDRVFVHALNTVKRIPRTGSARPPPSDRLKLYGLYKQSMEGNVKGVMDRPEGHGAEEAAEQSKWDAWSAQHGCTRTEAKRRYISTLIETMHKYASTTPESRELVAELEFVWDQIKSNSVASTTSSPLGGQADRSSSLLGLPPSQSHRQQQMHPSYASIGPGTAKEDTAGGAGLRMLRPVSDGDGDSEENETGDQANGACQTYFLDSRPDDAVGDPDAGAPSQSRDYEVRNRKWRKRIERTLMKMTIEIAALREQLEAKGHGARGRKMGTRMWMWMVSFALAAVKHLVIDALLVGLWMFWVGKGDERMRSAIGVFISVLKERIRKLAWKAFGTRLS